MFKKIGTDSSEMFDYRFLYFAKNHTHILRSILSSNFRTFLERSLERNL